MHFPVIWTDDFVKGELELILALKRPVTKLCATISQKSAIMAKSENSKI